MTFKGSTIIQMQVPAFKCGSIMAKNRLEPHRYPFKTAACFTEGKANSRRIAAYC